MLDKCAGIIVMKDEKILLGLRTDGQGWSLAGGKMEENETPYECALRELEEEFGLKAIDLMYLGQVEGEAFVKGIKQMTKPHIFLCQGFTGEVENDVREMVEYRWVGLDEIKEMNDFFPPTRAAIKTFVLKERE